MLAKRRNNSKQSVTVAELKRLNLLIMKINMKDYPNHTDKVELKKSAKLITSNPLDLEA